MPLVLSAQNNFDFEQYLQDLISFDEEKVSNLDYYDRLLQIYQHPINLNKAQKNDLEQLFILSQNQINQILEYREKNGKFLSIYELQAVPDMDINTISKLQYFVEVNSKNADSRTFSERLKEPDRHYLLGRFQRQIEKAEGNTRSKEDRGFLGDANKYLFRYRLTRYSDYSVGLTLEKDAGEVLKWDASQNYYVFDFVSGHLYRENLGGIKKLALGDYQLQFGQGLIFASGFSTGKGAETILSTKQLNSGIQAYGSALESGFQRGIAITVPLNNFLFSPFYSQKSIDANIQITDSSSFSEISSISNTGIHNTQNDLDKRLSSKEYLFGANINWSRKSARLGLTFAQQNYESNFVPQQILRNKYKFSGRENRNLGIDYDFNILNINLFGESAISSSGGIALVHGMIAALNSNTDVAIHYRNFQRNYHSIRGGAFSEGSSPINESGFYLGLSKKIRPSWKLSAYYDIFRFPWLSYLSKFPSQGNEALIRLEKRLSKSNSVYLQFRSEQKELSNSEANSPKKYLRKRSEWILQLSQSVNETISFRTRIQTKNVISNESSLGMAITQDLRIDYKKLRMDFRLSIFNTTDYESRIYVLERDVLFSLSAPAYFGQGSRNYVLLKYKAGKKLDLWLKWGRLLRTDIDYIGSGLNKSLGNSRNTLKFQMIMDL